MARCNSLNDSQAGRSKLDLTIRWLEALSFIMLMVGPNQDLQWKAQRPTEEMLGMKLITRSCLEKQLV